MLTHQQWAQTLSLRKLKRAHVHMLRKYWKWHTRVLKLSQFDYSYKDAIQQRSNYAELLAATTNELSARGYKPV